MSVFDVTEFFAYYKELNANNPADKKVTFNTVILKVIAYAIGAVTKKPVVVTEDGEDKIAIRSILPICIAFDHRALDFDDIIPMIKAFDEIFTNFGTIFSEQQKIKK